MDTSEPDGQSEVREAALMESCTHLDAIADVEPSDDGCHECLETGGQWLHLRMCQTCGHVGCCGDSAGQHATVHHHATGHPLVRSFEPGEEWIWCFEDQIMFELDGPLSLSHG